MTKVSREQLQRAAVAAKLYKDGVHQKDIARIIERQPGELGQKILPLARDRGYLVTTYDEDRVAQDGLDPLEVRAAAFRYPALYRAAEDRGIRISIVYSGPGESCDPAVWSKRSPGEWDERLRHFGRNAAPELSSVLRRAKHVGIAWGKTLHAPIAELGNDLCPPIRKPNGKPHHVVFVPTCGEPSRADGDQAGSSHLAEMANRLVNGDRLQPYSLKGSPAMLHASFSKQERDVIRRSLRLNPNYCEIFGDPNVPGTVPLVKKLDTILTSIASLGQPAKMFGRELLEFAGVSRDDQKNILGDVGGVFWPTEKADRRVFDEVASLWTGISLQEYKRVGRDAAAGKSPGVVVFAIGGSKSAFLNTLLKSENCFLSHLIIDHELAQCLEALL